MNQASKRTKKTAAQVRAMKAWKTRRATGDPSFSAAKAWATRDAREESEDDES